ncbi:hypothetical protein C8Q74DRAFT_1156596, partial [Fomes fomentarius]
TSWNKEEAWLKTATKVQKAHDEKVDAWNSELDYFLVYSGIFSRIVASFVGQAYPLL